MLTCGTFSNVLRFLPPLVRGEEYWCQFFSEPGSGSDLASAQEHCDVPALASFALPPLLHLLYRPQPRQICKIGKVPAYGTLPSVSSRSPINDDSHLP